MAWLQWAVPLFFFVLWLINTVIKSQEDPRRPVSKPRQAGEDADQENARPRRTPAEIDKFLEEVRRRKQAKEQGGAVPPPLPPVVAEERPRPAPRQPTQRTSRPEPVRPVRSDPVRTSRPEPARPARSEPARVELRPLPPSPPPAPVPVEPVPVVQPVSEMQGINTLMLFPHDTTGKRSSSNSVKALHTFMQNRTNLATAFLLTEVFGKPLSKRKGGPFSQ